MIYLVAWSGGYDEPSYVIKASETEAWQQAREWATDNPNAIEDGDSIEVLSIDPSTLTIEKLGSI